MAEKVDARTTLPVAVVASFVPFASDRGRAFLLAGALFLT